MDTQDAARRLVRDAIALIAAVEDPQERDREAVAFGTFLREQAAAEVREVRQANAKGLHDQGLSLAQIGGLLDLDRNRVGGIIAGRSGGKRRPRGKSPAVELADHEARTTDGQ
jgi:hypothetical protein